MTSTSCCQESKRGNHIVRFTLMENVEESELREYCEPMVGISTVLVFGSVCTIQVDPLYLAVLLRKLKISGFLESVVDDDCNCLDFEYVLSEFENKVEMSSLRLAPSDEDLQVEIKRLRDEISRLTAENETLMVENEELNRYRTLVTTPHNSSSNEY